ncbi:hypothetical protein [Lactococcus lactis]|uniref:hypothetical protein n=1 Tax=Lactococcus lactis TaxID=1358 RepID=UPI002073920B|nr:hypothetical protein [Lactococcus lactis]
MSGKKIQVIKIIDEFTILINAGSSSTNIKIDDQIVVYEKGPEIKDIDGTILGTYDFDKAELLITKVGDNFSVAKNHTKNVPLSVGKILGGGYSSNGPLPIDDEDQITNLEPKNLYISIGDLVKII